MRLVLFRHGPAEPRNPRRWPDDSTRPLTKEGVAETRKAAHGLASLDLPWNRVIASDAERARRTGELVRRALKIDQPLDHWEELRPGEPAAPILGRIRRLKLGSKVPVLVGHEPTLGELVGLALWGEAISAVHLSKAGAALVEFSESSVPGGGTLEWLLTRRQLTGLGR